MSMESFLISRKISSLSVVMTCYYLGLVKICKSRNSTYMTGLVKILCPVFQENCNVCRSQVKVVLIYLDATKTYVKKRVKEF